MVTIDKTFAVQWYIQKFVSNPKPMISKEEFLAAARFKTMSEDRYKGNKDREWMKENKGPEHTMMYMREIAKELDDAFLSTEESPPGGRSDPPDDDDDNDRGKDDRDRSRGGRGKKRSRRDKSDDERSVDEDFDPSTPVKGRKDTKSRGKSSTKKKRLDMPDESKSRSQGDRGRERSGGSNKSHHSSDRRENKDRPRSGSYDRRSGKHKRSPGSDAQMQLDRGHDDDTVKNRRSNESKRSSTGSNKSSGSGTSSSSGSSSKTSGSSSSSSSGQSKDSAGIRGSPRSARMATMVLPGADTPKRDTRMGHLSKE